MLFPTVMGFVVNTYDALNYDIDFPFVEFDQPEFKLLQNVISNVYHYKNIMHNGELSTDLKSHSYRCRLNGIEIDSKNYSRRQIKTYANDIKKLIDRVDGWLMCTFKGVDVFQRLLLDITIPQLNLNLCDYLLIKASEDKFPPFSRYVANKNTKIKPRAVKN